MPWLREREGFEDRAWHCAFLACEAALEVLRSCASGVWEPVELRFATLSELFRDLVNDISGQCAHGGAGANGADGADSASKAPEFRGTFQPLGQGVLGLAALLRSLAVAIPALLWCCTGLPKGAKKAKEGQEALHSARVALRGLLSAVLAGLTDLQTALSQQLKAKAVPTWDTRVPEIAALRELPELSKFREQVRSTLMEAHSGHLQALRDSMAARLALLKTRSSFKA